MHCTRCHKDFDERDMTTFEAEPVCVWCREELLENQRINKREEFAEDKKLWK